MLNIVFLFKHSIEEKEEEITEFKELRLQML